MTPMLKQYLEIKKQYPEAILFFRLGDFYEMFFEDAKKASQILDITLTSRESGKGNRIPMCGIPFHAAQGYINRLTREGLKVAICEQVEDPKLCKDIVKREVIRVITPGTNIDEEAISGENFIAAVYFQAGSIGFAYLNLGTGYFQITELRKLEDFIGEFTRIKPTECIIPENLEKVSPALFSFLKKDSRLTLNHYETWVFEFEYAGRIIKEQFKLASLEGLGLDGYEAGISAAGAIIYFLNDNLHSSLPHLKRPRPYSSSEFMLLDSKTQRNLEILESISGDKSGVTLFKILNKTVTPLGSRLLRQWISKPLVDSYRINERLEGVEEMSANHDKLLQLRGTMRDIRDLERILGRLSCGLGSARDLVALKQSLEKLPEIKRILSHFNSSLIKEQQSKLLDLDFLANLINRAIVDCPPLSVREGGMIRPGYSSELDELYQISRHGKDFLGELQQREINRTGIKSLKVRYNKVFGYYIEITKANLNQVPDYYIRRQTLANAERFIIPELKEYEEKILNAEERAFQLELEIFEEIRNQVLNNTEQIQTVAEAVATLDVLSTFAILAGQYRYVRPIIDNSAEITIRNGRHPVVERVLEAGEFVENDTYLNRDDHQLIVLTGPNMAGKSTYLRQVALIVLMAQIGSFVPADFARLGVVDKIFTRIGASDNLARGESTFMVEMIETAYILNNVSERSLVILDEIGRGTSTYDGVSIAWAVVEYLTKINGPRPKTLFATHYHELTALEGVIPGVKNYNVMVKEDQDEIIFIRKITPGGSDRSYGIQVAKLAGLPEEVIFSAQKVLADLENGKGEKDLPLKPRKVKFSVVANRGREKGKGKNPQKEKGLIDLPLFNFSRNESSLLQEIRELDIQNLTPLEALNWLNQFKEKTKTSSSQNQPIPFSPKQLWEK